MTLKRGTKTFADVEVTFTCSSENKTRIINMKLPSKGKHICYLLDPVDYTYILTSVSRVFLIKADKGLVIATIECGKN